MSLEIQRNMGILCWFIVFHGVGWLNQPRIQVPGSPFLIWPGGNRHGHSSSSHHCLENLEVDRAQQLWGRSKVIVRIWTFNGAEKESESEGGEKGVQHIMECTPSNLRL